MGKKITIARYEPYEGYRHEEYDLDTISDYDKKELAKELAEERDGIVIELPGCTRASLGSLYPLYKEYKDKWDNGGKKKRQKENERRKRKYEMWERLRTEANDTWREWENINRCSFSPRELEVKKREYFIEVEKIIAEESENI